MPAKKFPVSHTKPQSTVVQAEVMNPSLSQQVLSKLYKAFFFTWPSRKALRSTYRSPSTARQGGPSGPLHGALRAATAVSGCCNIEKTSQGLVAVASERTAGGCDTGGRRASLVTGGQQPVP